MTAGDGRGDAGRRSPHPLPERLRDHLRRRPDLLPEGARVVVAVSGGADSMALLHLLAGLGPSRHLTLLAAHFDHGLREGSADEARRVVRWCRAMGVECRTGRPEEPLPPDQASLRKARYAYLAGVLRESGFDRLVTGHQADDQVETVLFRLLRGTGLGGLAGIPERRGPLVRPLLPFRSSELRAHLERHGLPWLEDPSNRDLRRARARIRHRVLPALESAWPGPVGQRLLELGRMARRADRALERRARRLLRRALVDPAPDEDGIFVLRRLPLLRADEESRGRMLRMVARSLGANLTRGGTRSGVEFISEGRSGGRVDLGGNLAIRREFDRFRMGRLPVDGESEDRTLLLRDPGPGRGSLELAGRRWRVAWWPGGPRSGQTRPAPDTVWPEGEGECEKGSCLVARRAALDFPLELRAWRPGDRLRGTSGSRKLKRLFNDRRVPLSERHRVPLLVSEGGGVLWVAGIDRWPGLDPAPGDPLFTLRMDRV